MIRTYEIDLDDRLVEDSSKVFDSLGSDIDSAIKIFLTQAVLRKGFPFEIAVPDEKTGESAEEKLIEKEADSSIPEKAASDEDSQTEEQIQNPSGCESDSVENNQNPEPENSEDEDETAPENLFAQWTFGSARKD